MLTVIAKIISKFERIEETKALLIRLVPLTLKEEGCLQYDLHQGSLDKHIFFLYETWTDTEALERHFQSRHLRELSEAAPILLASPMKIYQLGKV